MLRFHQDSYAAIVYRIAEQGSSVSQLVEIIFISKGQIISECPYEIIVWTKIPTKKISKISALASKERSKQKK